MVQKFLGISEIRKLLMKFQPFNKPQEISRPRNLVEYTASSAFITLEEFEKLRFIILKTHQMFLVQWLRRRNLKEQKLPIKLCLVTMQQLVIFLTNIYWFSLKQNFLIMHHYFTRIYLDLEDIRKATAPKLGGKKTNTSRFPDHDEHVQLSTKD